jgi:drug/metabolite transporter (DMT)-like permease
VTGWALVGYVLLCLIWGSTWLGIKIGLDAGMPPLLGVSLRFALAAVVLLPIAWTRSREIFHDRVAWRLATMLGVLSFGVGYGCTYLGGVYVPSGLGSLTFGAFPFWVAVLAHFVLADRLTAGKALAIAIGIAGLVTLYWGSLVALGPEAVLGIGIITTSVLIQGFAQVYVKRDGGHVPAAFLSGVGMGIGSLVLAGLAALRGEWSQPFPTSAPVLGSIAYLAVFGSVVTFLIYYRLLKTLSATLMAMVALITPPIAVVLGLIFKGERLGAITLTGGAMVLLGVYLFQLAERRG